MVGSQEQNGYAVALLRLLFFFVHTGYYVGLYTVERLAFFLLHIIFMVR